MSRRENMPGWGARIKAVRIRLALSRAAFARLFGVAPTTVRGWEDEDAGTTPLTIKRGLALIGAPDVDRVLSWLTDGDGAPPPWLDGDPGTPIPPEGPSGLVAMPQEVLDAGREAFKILDGARAVGELRDEPSIEAWRVLKSFREALPNPSPDTRQDSPFLILVNLDNTDRIHLTAKSYANCRRSGESSHIIRLDDLQNRERRNKSA